ncbi:LmeA family phospholipid-binding protein [Kineosporia sp. NBRC 101731]|uniref:LmeA family phospholipid-binding protein n=1 Tax=Kineosporia sp. NBRC 101731 TaxID=3032199 RepID=UPI002552B51F|nr:LmeA family phospholipid-binding protein [Kineosporia sp. NBRC 101731]
MHTEDLQARVNVTPSGTPWFRRRRLVVITAGLVVLAVLAVVANVMVTRYVKDQVVRVLRCATDDDTLDPTVSLGSTPLLFGLVSGEVRTVTIGGLSTTAVSGLDSRKPVSVPEGTLSVTLDGLGVRKPHSVESAQASVHLPWGGLGDRLDSEADLTGATLAEKDGLLAVALPQKVAGEQVTALVSLGTDGDSLTVTPESVIIGGRQIGIGLVSLLTGDLLKDENGESRLEPRVIDLNLPQGTTLETVKVQSEGLDLDLGVDPAQIGKSGAAGRNCLA